MANIHYFQRYSTRENTVTNNTMQLLARVYTYSPTQASRLLSKLTNEEVEIGIEINQQQKGSGGSVPDAMIIQRSFKIVVEAKIDSSVNIDQLERHTESFSHEKQKILLLLSKEKNQSIKSEKFKEKNIIFTNVTYENICDAISSMFKEHEYEMCELVEDYKAYCRDTGLIDESGNLMRIVPCGHSWRINCEHGIYFHPKDRGYSPHQYLGIYNQKAVLALFKIDGVFDAECSAGELGATVVLGEETEEYRNKIATTIREAREQCGYDIENGHRFFCGKPFLTKYRKISPGGIQGARYINLKREIPEGFKSAEDIAEKLKSKEWE